MMDQELAARLAEDSEFHSRILAFALHRIKASERFFAARHPTWREAERLYRFFREPDDSDNEVASQSLTEGVKKIVIPYSFSTVLSILAFLMTTFLQRKPVIPVEGIGPNDVKPALLHEHLLEYQMDHMDTKGVHVMMQWFLDFLRYGVGIVKTVWTVREWVDLVRTMQPIIDPYTGEQLGMQDDLREDEVVAYEGNTCINVSPFDFYPDPRVPIGNFQRGEFCAHRMRRSHSELLVKQAEGVYVGIREIPEARSTDDASTETGRTSSGGQSDLAFTLGMNQEGAPYIDEYGKPFVTLHEMYAQVIPAQLGLPTSGNPDMPRLWVFTVANRARVIRAEPANLPGRKYPFDVIEPFFDLHSPVNPGIIEAIAGPNYIASWLLNSRMQNVRKTLNNELIIDPSIINVDDFEHPNPGGIIRLNKDVYGAFEPGKAIFPVPTVDVTAQHMQDHDRVAAMIEQISGANRLVQGLANTGRRSASEVQSQMNLAFGRLNLMSVNASMGMASQAETMVKNTQTFFQNPLMMQVQDPYRHIVGADQVMLTPDMLQGLFRFPFLEQGIPTDKAFTANTYREMLTLGFQNPQAAMMLGINLAEIFVQLLRTLGVRNIRDFVVPPMQVMPDQQVQQQMQAGNMVANPATQPSDGFPLPPEMGSPGTGSNGAQQYS